MKTLLVAVAVLSVLALGTMAFGHGFGAWGGGHMMGRGQGGHMYGWGTPYYSEDSGAGQKFLDETADLRKDLHNKTFEYREARRDPGTDTGTLAKLEKEIYELRAQIYKNAPRNAYGGGGFGHCF